MLRELLIRIGMIVGTGVFLFIQYAVFMGAAANKMGLSKEVRTLITRVVIVLGFLIAITLAILPLESAFGFLVAVFMMVIGLYGMADGLYQLSFSDLRPQFWGKSYKPITERVLGADGRRELRQAWRLFGGAFLMLVGIAMMVVVVSNVIGSER